MTKKGKVLIIDDEADLCLLMKSFFSKKEYEVFIVHTLAEGLEELNKIKPDIVFLDNNLPDGLGWTKAPLIMQQFPQLKLHLISAYHPDLPAIKITPNVKIWEKPLSLKAIEAHLFT
jgi:DNA-binding response OmpR family regulator